ncbi:hypothetical protein QWY84_17750 [Aquisalimonas lutea]|uniref:hypothetical protein n=1 Tax=Aquisalimonas lutea TaxID=1327750 RepID=UPI0025B5288E|nr:hypothetical protein [Aquisalimonas lutea]MDN3519454.1 hypothetical protein [Aquisalimonas lutea]
MNSAEVVHASERQEADRIAFVEQAHGTAHARVFAEQTLRLYRRAVVQRAAPAGEKTFRLRLLGSYCYLKRYLAGNCGSDSSR